MGRGPTELQAEPQAWFRFPPHKFKRPFGSQMLGLQWPNWPYMKAHYCTMAYAWPIAPLWDCGFDWGSFKSSLPVIPKHFPVMGLGVACFVSVFRFSLPGKSRKLITRTAHQFHTEATYHKFTRIRRFSRLILYRPLVYRNQFPPCYLRNAKSIVCRFKKWT